MKTTFDFVFSFVAQLKMRSLGLGKIPIKQQNFKILILQIFCCKIHNKRNVLLFVSIVPLKHSAVSLSMANSLDFSVLS